MNIRAKLKTPKDKLKYGVYRMLTIIFWRKSSGRTSEARPMMAK
jgi:hypothetical protein